MPVSTTRRSPHYGSKLLAKMGSVCYLISNILLCNSAYSVDVQNDSLKNNTAADSTIVITTGRVAEPLDQVIAPTTVITREQIEQQQLSSLTEALGTVPGISIRNTGGVGKSTSVFLRGSNSSHLVVLVDGIRAGSLTLGSFAFEQYPIEQIERIEVVRGPFSSLYGMDAIGGVIQIFTHSPTLKDSTQTPTDNRPERVGKLGLSFSRYNTTHHSLQLQQHGQIASLTAKLTTAETDGFNALENSDPDDDGAEIDTKSLQLNLKPSDTHSLQLSWFNSQSDVEYDPSFTGSDDNNITEQSVISIRASQQITPHWHSEFTVGQAKDYYRSYLNTSSPPGFLVESQRDMVSLIHHWQHTPLPFFDESHLTLGFDYLNDQINENDGFVETQSVRHGVFISQTARWQQLTLQMSGRSDHLEEHDTITSGSARLAWSNEALGLSLSRGTAFKAPTFGDLYNSFSGTVTLFPLGERTVEPETSGTTEVGAHFQPSATTRLESYLYKTTISNLITYPSPELIATNIDQSRIRGWETTLQQALGLGIQLNAQVTLMQALNRSRGANNNNDLLYRPRRTAVIDLSKPHHDWLFGIKLEGVSERFADAENSLKVPGYGLVSTRVQLQASPLLRLQAKVENLFDRSYQTSLNYNQPRRLILFAVDYQFL